MGCKWASLNDGKCELYDGTIEMPVDEDGFCKVEDDPAPDCEDYEEV